jgi:hypothetical protein
MGGRLKRIFWVTDEEGKQALSIIRTALGLVSAALVTLLVSWFVWVSTQAYDVATNKKLIADTADRLQMDILANKGLIEKNNAIHHMRETKIDDKYDAKIAELQRMFLQQNTLIVEILSQQHKEVELKKEEVQIQQRILKNGR